MIKKSVSLIAFATVLGAFGGAYAAAGDNAIVTSKAYVDNTKQEKIAGHAANAADSLLTDSATDGTVQKRAIFNDTAANYDSTTQSTQIPTMGAVMSAISSDSQSPIPAGTNGYLATHSGSEGTFGTPVNPATFQTAIKTGMVDFNKGSTDLPAIATYDTTGGLVANKIGILNEKTILNDEGSLNAYISTNGYGAEMDNYVPTVRAVAEGLYRVAKMTAELPWNTAEQNATDAYSTTFADSGTNVWPTTDLDKVVKGQTFANAMATKQNKIAGHAANAADSLLTDSATDGTVQKRAIFNRTVANYDSTTQSTQIPTMGAVMSAVSAGVSAAAPSGDPNTIANYGANGALGSGIATYSGATQQSPYNAGNDAGKIATAAAVETKQTKKVCYGWPDDVEHTDANCWLWTLPD